MRKTLSTLVVLGLIWLGYAAWPLYDLLLLVRAVEAREVDTVTRRVNFVAVRMSLTNQIFDAYIRRSGIQISPLAQSAMSAFSIADPIVAKLVSPEALSALLSTGWPVTVLPERPAGTAGITSDAVGTVWQIFASSEYRFGRFEVSVPASFPPPQRFGLGFRLTQWRWRLDSVILPENIQDLLADELIKMTKKP